MFGFSLRRVAFGKRLQKPWYCDSGRDMAILLAQYDEVNKLEMFQDASKACPVHLVWFYSIA